MCIFGKAGYTMATKLGVRLREVKEDLEETIDRLEQHESDPFDAIHAKYVIDSLTYGIENQKIELAALNASVSMRIESIPNRRCKKILKDFLKVVEEELPIEEEIDALEDIILKSEIISSEREYDLQQEIHSEARAIARLFISNRK